MRSTTGRLLWRARRATRSFASPVHAVASSADGGGGGDDDDGAPLAPPGSGGAVCIARLLAVREVTPSVKEFRFEAAALAAAPSAPAPPGATPSLAAAGGESGGEVGGGDQQQQQQQQQQLKSALHFEAGQWLDFKAPGVDVVGGFSLTSTAAELPALSLAVKASGFAPVRWLHERAAVGDEVLVRVGGDCSLDVDRELEALLRRQGDGGGCAGAGAAAAAAAAAAEPTPPPPPLPSLHVVLVAGGIGITPLLSMLRHADEWLGARHAAYDACAPADRAGRRAALAAARRLRVTLLHSAASADELAYREETAAVAMRHPGRIRCQYFETGQGGGGGGGGAEEEEEEEEEGEELAQEAGEGGVLRRAGASTGASTTGAVGAVALARQAAAGGGGNGDGDGGGTWRGRIGELVLRGVAGESIASDAEHLVAYVCGPVQMIRDTKAALLRCGCDEADVRFETWW